MATLLKTTGEKIYLKPRRHKFSLEELQKAVGGEVDYLSAGPTHFMCVDAHAKVKGLPANKNATDIIRQFGGPTIVGDAVFLEKRDII